MSQSEPPAEPTPVTSAQEQVLPTEDTYPIETTDR
jgi:hypothetical protein